MNLISSKKQGFYWKKLTIKSLLVKIELLTWFRISRRHLVIIITYDAERHQKISEESFSTFNNCSEWCLQTTSEGKFLLIKKESGVLLTGAEVDLEKIVKAENVPNYLSIYRKNYNGLEAVHQCDEL